MTIAQEEALRRWKLNPGATATEIGVPERTAMPLRTHRLIEPAGGIAGRYRCTSLADIHLHPRRGTRKDHRS